MNEHVAEPEITRGELSKIRVGLIGASLGRAGWPARPAWAVEAHGATITAHESLSLQAVATTQLESAQTAARYLGARCAYASATDLIADPDVDLVVIGVNVAHHADIAREALTQGKNILCEWPLAVDSSQASELAAHAMRTSKITAVSMQARHSPALVHARNLLSEGYVGRISSLNVVSASPYPGSAKLPDAYRALADVHNGATLLSIQVAHCLDAIQHLIGDLRWVSGDVECTNPVATIIETGEHIPKSSEDYVAISGRSAEGIPVNATFTATSRAAISTILEVRGDEGVIRIYTTQPRQFQVSPLALSGCRGSGDPEPLTIPPALVSHIPPDLRGTPAENVSGVYQDIVRAIRTGAQPAVGFQGALRHHQLLDMIRQSSETSAGARIFVRSGVE